MAVVALSLYVLFVPQPAGPEGPPGADKVVHLLLFAALAASSAWRWGRRTTVLLAVLAYAALSELVQGVALAERSGDLLDLLADALGAGVAWAVLARRARRTP